MKANNNLTYLYKFAYQAAGLTLPPSPTKDSPTHKNSPGNRSRSSLARNSPRSNQNKNSKQSSKSSEPRFLDISRKPEIPKRIVRESGEEDSVNPTRKEKNISTLKDNKNSQKELQQVLSSERQSEDNVRKLRGSHRSSGNQSSERLKSNKNAQTSEREERKSLEKSKDGNSSRKNIGVNKDNREISTERRSEIENNQEEKKTDTERNVENIQKQEVYSRRNDEEKEILQDQIVNKEEVKITITNADKARESNEKDSQKPMPNFSENSPSLIGSPVQYQVIGTDQIMEDDLETLLQKGESPIHLNNYGQMPEKDRIKDVQKKVKEYRERNPYPCYAQASFKGIISRKNRSKGRSEKLRSLRREEIANYSEHQTLMSMTKETELQNGKTLRATTEESPVVLQTLMKKNLQVQEDQFRRGRKQLVPLAKNDGKSKERSFIVDQASSLEGLEGEAKVNHIKMNILRCASISRMSSLEREKEQNELGSKKEKKKEVDTDQSLLQARKIQTTPEPVDKYGGDNPVVRNAIIMEKMKQNYLNFLEKKKLVPKQHRKQSRVQNEKVTNIRNIYGLEDSTQKIDMLLHPSNQRGRSAAVSEVGTKSEATPIISNQRSSSSFVEANVKGNNTTHDNAPSKKAPSTNQRSLKSIATSHKNSMEKIDNLVKPVLKVKNNTPRNLSPESVHQNDVSLLNQSAIDQGIKERGKSIGYVNLFDKRSISTVKRPPPHRTCFNDPERSPGPKYDLSGYKGFGEPRKLPDVDEFISRKDSKPGLDNKLTDRSYQNLVKDSDADAGRDSQYASYMQPSSQRSTIVSGKGINFGKAKRDILYPLKAENPGPGKYEMPPIVHKGIKFGNERKSLKFFFPKLKDIKIANPV